MSNDREAPQSRAEALIQNILGESYVVEPQSRVEKILYAIANNGTYTDPPQSRIEALLIEVLNNGGGGGGGGGSTPVEPKDVNFIDYDGTILYSYTKQEALALEALPANPTHTGLTSQGWNYTLAQVKTECNAVGGATVGQMYITSDGKTRIYIHVEKGRNAPYLGLGVNGTVTVNWGDGTSTSTLTGTSTSTLVSAQHTYTPGDYVIELTVSESGSIAFLGTSNLSQLLSIFGGSTSANISKVYANMIQKVELGKGLTGIGAYAFLYAGSLKSITMPNSITNIGSGAFSNCYCLSGIVIPSTVTSIGDTAFTVSSSLINVSIPISITGINASAFSSCSSLARVTIPSTVTSIGNSAFSNCLSLKIIIIPNGVTSIGTNAFQYAYSLSDVKIPSSLTSISGSAFHTCPSLACVTIPSSVTSIGNNAFYYAYGIKEYHFESTTPPTLSNTTAIYMTTDCVIYVPRSEDQAVLNAYKTASSYWSQKSSYMQEEPA